MGTINLLTDRERVFKTVCETFNKNENEVNQDIETIKTWLQAQRHLPEIMKDSHIRNFLILNKFSVENTKPKIDMYYTIRSLIPDFYDECNPKLPRMLKAFNNIEFGFHPKLVQNLYRVYMAKITTSEFSLRDSIVTVSNIGEVRLDEDCVYYDIFLIDMSNFRFTDLTKLTPDVVMKAFTLYEKVYSLRVKSIHFFNAPTYISKVLDILKSFLKPKIFQRISVHANDEILKEIFTIDDLPKDYGGYGPSLQEISDLMKKKFDEHQDRFDQLDKMRVDESLRPEKLTNDEVLGYYGNFKKLDVD